MRPLIVFHFFVHYIFYKHNTPPCPRSTSVSMLRDANTEYHGASDKSQISSPRVPQQQSPNASLLEHAGLDDLEIFGTMAEPQASPMRGPHMILPQTIMTYRDRHGSDSQSTKSAHQPFCGCRFGFGAAFSEISKMVHDLTRWLNERIKEVYNHYMKKRQYVAVPNDNTRRTFKNRVNEHTPLLSRPKQKQKVARKTKLTAAVQKRVLIPEVDIESLLTSAAKTDWLAQDDIQEPSLAPQTKICSVPIDFGTGPSNALRIFVDPSYGQPIQLPPSPPPQTRTTELSSTGSLERRWNIKPPEDQSERHSHLTCAFGDWNGSDQVPIHQDQFNYTRPRPQTYIVRDHPVYSTFTTGQCPQQPSRVDDSQSEERTQPERIPSRLTRTKSRIRASLGSLPGLLPSRVMASLSSIAIPSTMTASSARKPSHSARRQ